MKLVSLLPSLIARLGSLVERDVTSDLEVFQQSGIQLPNVPFPPRPYTAGSNNVVNESSVYVFNSITVTNGALSAVTMARLTPGIYRITAAGNYLSNYQDLTVDGLVLRLIATVEIGRLAYFRPMNLTVPLVIEQWVSLEAPITNVSLELGGNGVGQTHHVAACIGVEKYL